MIKLICIAALSLLLVGCATDERRVENFRIFTEALATYMNDRNISGYVKGGVAHPGIGSINFCAQSGDSTVCSQGE